jgi:hypothetical protein
VSDEGELFLIMEFVGGETLARVLTGRPVPPAIASSIILGTLRGLHAAHETRAANGAPLNIVHRDISPRNILVGVDGLARVLDFGIAKAVGNSHVTRDGALKGTLAYMAPEHLRSEPVTRLADIYATSVTLWELLTGRQLFAGESDAAVLVQVLAGPVEPPSKHASDLPAGLDALVLRGLHRDRSRRFPTAHAMANELERVLTPASPGTVADWLEDRAGTTMKRHAAALAAFDLRTGNRRLPRPMGGGDANDAIRQADDAGPASGATAGGDSDLRQARESRLRRRWAAYGGFTVLSVLAALFFASSGAEPRPPARRPKEFEGTRTGFADPPTISVAPQPSAGSKPTAIDPEPHDAWSAPAPNARVDKLPQPSCDPPFSIEGGHKVFKRWCL